MADVYDITIVWNEVSNIDLDRYELWRSDDGILFDQLVKKTDSVSFIDKSLVAGTYYYLVYAVDEVENFSAPSSIEVKTAPPDSTAPATPMGVTAIRTAKLEGVELFWEQNIETDLKGYIIYRSYDGISYHVAEITSSNFYTDTRIPPRQDTDSNSTPVLYAISAYDTSFNESAASSPTDPLAIPLITGLRGIVDFLSINVYWDSPHPEVMPGPTPQVQVYYKRSVDPTWILEGTVDYPQNSIRIPGELLKDTAYDIGIVVLPFTGGTPFFQPDTIVKTIPDYEQDTTPPNSPILLQALTDPRENRILLSWRRHIVDDDLLYYAVYSSGQYDISGIAGSDTFQLHTSFGNLSHLFRPRDILQIINSTSNDGLYTVDTSTYSGGTTNIKVLEAIPVPGDLTGDVLNFNLDATTKNNDLLIRDPYWYYLTSYDTGFYVWLLVTAVDRSGNVGTIDPTAYAVVQLKSAGVDVMDGPYWIDVRILYDSSPSAGDFPSIFESQYDIQWNDNGRAARLFRRYVVFEVIAQDGVGLPVFNFTEDEIRGYVSDNSFRVYNDKGIVGSPSTGFPIVSLNQGLKLFTIAADKSGYFAPGDIVTVVGSTGNDGAYTVVNVNVPVGPVTDITVAEAIPSAVVDGSIYSQAGFKWYAIAAEDWWGGTYIHALGPAPFFPVIRIP